MAAEAELLPRVPGADSSRLLAAVPPFQFSPGNLIVLNYTDATHMQIVHEGLSF